MGNSPNGIDRSFSRQKRVKLLHHAANIANCSLLVTALKCHLIVLSYLMNVLLKKYRNVSSVPAGEVVAALRLNEPQLAKCSSG